MIRRDSHVFSPRIQSTLLCYWLVLPTIALLLTFVYLPVVWAFSKSLYEFEIGAAPRFIGLDNYTEAIRDDPATIPSLVHMAFFTFIAVAMRLTLPLFTAKLICSLPQERWRFFYRIVFLVPIVVPGVAVQLIWMGLIYGDNGLINNLLQGIGLPEWTRGWINDPSTALICCSLVGFPFIGGFEVLVYYAGLAKIPASVNEAALLEGCVGVRKFFSIDIPMVMSQLKLILLLTIIGGVQGFEGILVLTRGGPGFKTMMPGLWMYLNAFSFQRFGYACAIGVLLFLLILVITALNMKYFKSTEQLEGIQ